MADSSTSSVFIIADPERAEQLSSGLAELGVPVDVVISDGSEAVVELFLARRPTVVVIAATLQHADARSLIANLRGLVERGTVGFVVAGDEHGPVRTEVDATAFAPDRFVSWPHSPDALRIAVRAVLDAAAQRSIHLSTPSSGVLRTPAQPGLSNAVDNLVGDSAASATADAVAWEPLADILGETDDAAVEAGADNDDAEPAPLPPLFEIRPRRDHQSMVEIQAWDASPVPRTARSRDSSLVIRAPDPDPPAVPTDSAPRVRNPTSPPPIPAIRSRGFSGSPVRTGATPAIAPDDEWSEPTPLSEVVERIENLGSTGVYHTPDPARQRWLDRPSLDDGLPIVDPLDGLDVDQKIVSASPMYDVGEFDDPDLIVPTPVPPRAVEDDPGSGQDFARQLRAKMSLMAQRLFHNEAGPVERSNGEPRGSDLGDVHLAALGPDLQLDRGGVTTIARVNFERRERTVSASAAGSWHPGFEREFSDAGELERGICDAAIVLAKTFARKVTGRVAFRYDDIEKVVFVDAGRPVFASSNAPGDRMGELLVREGKITAAQYDRCQADVIRTGRRIGEILVDFGYLKRRELLPAVRRHVEDIVFSLFGWTRGHYQVMPEPAASTERIRMSRHPASLILEGIRRKLDRATLERLVGPPSTIVDIASRERLNAMVNASDLVEEERAALAAFDGRADLASVARTAAVDVADVLPLAWGLCVLELATARRVETEDASAALVGETDLAIDRERIRARWNLVTEADYFALLGVRRDATGFEIRRAYQSARRDFAAENFSTDVRREFSRELADIATVLDEAFRVMRDDKLRLQYRSHLPDSENP